MPNKIHLFLLSILLAPSAHAEDVTSTVNLFGTTFSYGTPPWIDTESEDFKPPDLLSKSKNFKDQKGPSFILEAIPADEEFDTWSTMFAVKALDTGQKISMSTWEDNTLDTFRQFCGDVSIRYLEMGRSVSLVQVICPKIIGYTQDGYNDGVGEIGLFAFYVNGTTLISHYIEWRGDAFSPLDKSGWPVSQDVIDRSIAAVKKSSAANGDTIVKFAE